MHLGMLFFSWYSTKAHAGILLASYRRSFFAPTIRQHLGQLTSTVYVYTTSKNAFFVTQTSASTCVYDIEKICTVEKSGCKKKICSKKHGTSSRYNTTRTCTSKVHHVVYSEIWRHLLLQYSQPSAISTSQTVRVKHDNFGIHLSAVALLSWHAPSRMRDVGNVMQTERKIRGMVSGEKQRKSFGFKIAQIRKHLPVLRMKWCSM